MSRDRQRLDDIVARADEAIAFLDGVSVAAFRNDRRLQLAVERLLEIIGEAAGGLSEQPRDRIAFDWRALRGLRNVIAHQYGAVDHARLYRTVVERLPALVRAIRAGAAADPDDAD